MDTIKIIVALLLIAGRRISPVHTGCTATCADPIATSPCRRNHPPRRAARLWT